MNINTKEDTHKGIKMKNINEMLQLINEVNGYSDREAFSSKIFDIYNHIKENPNKDLKLFFIEYALLYDLFWALSKQTPRKLHEEKSEDGKSTMWMIPEDENYSLYAEYEKKLQTIIIEKSKEILGSENQIDYGKESVTRIILQTIKIIKKQDKDLSFDSKGFFSFCAYYENKNEYYKKINGYIVYYFTMLFSFKHKSMGRSGDYFTYIDPVLNENKSKYKIVTWEIISSWFNYEEFFINEYHFSRMLKYVIHNEPFISLEYNENQMSTEIIDKFLLTALDCDFYDYPGFYLSIVQLIKLIDSNQFIKLFKPSSDILSNKTDDVLYKEVLKEETGKDGLTSFENMQHTKEYSDSEAGLCADFIKGLLDHSSKDNKDYNGKILQYLSFCALWELAGNIQESSGRDAILNDFFKAAVLSDDWKKEEVLIELLNKISGEMNFCQSNAFSGLTMNGDFTKLEYDVRNAAVFLLTRNQSNGEGAQLALINQLDKLRDEKFLCKPDYTIRYYVKDFAEPGKDAKAADEAAKQAADKAIGDCDKNREYLKKIDMGFNYIYNDKYLEKVWIDCLTSYKRKMKCKLFHEADMAMLSQNSNFGYDKFIKEAFYHATYKENYSVANKNCLKNNYLLLVRHQKTHGDHHAITNLLKNQNSDFFIALQDGRKHFKKNYKNCTKLEERKIINFNLKKIDFVKNRYLKEIKKKGIDTTAFDSDGWETALLSDDFKNACNHLSFDKEYYEYVESMLYSLFAVEDDFLYRHFNQVNVYLLYMALKLINEKK